MIYLKDYYKSSHVFQYPPKTTLLFSNFTPRKSRMEGVNHSVFFGLKYFIKEFLESFFQIGDDAFNGYKGFMWKTLGSEIDYNHILELKKLKYVPIAIYALPELSVVPCGVPALVMFNTHKDYFWLPGMLETALSAALWPMCTSATTAREYRLILDKFAEETCDSNAHVDYQAHDFSMRGMFGIEAGMMSGMAHLQYFKGTDSIPAIMANKLYYGKELHLASVPATEHSVASAYGKENELEYFRRIIEDVHPSGFVSIVSDTWDLWNTVSSILPSLRESILARSGRVVIRPDSGDPVDILCGIEGVYQDPSARSPKEKGLIECLWELFGGTTNSKGFKVLDGHIGAIYGDSITLSRARAILQRFKEKGFASSNVSFGIGSFSYQLVSRDTLGWALKSTYCEIDGIGKAITKDPITDDGTKKSASGLLKVVKEGDSFKLLQNQTWDEFFSLDNQLKLVYKDGKTYT